jgi:hypothetical protein
MRMIMEAAVVSSTFIKGMEFENCWKNPSQRQTRFDCPALLY